MVEIFVDVGRRRGAWLAPLLFVASLGASSSDGGLADAVKSRDHEAVRLLLAQHAEVNTAQADGATALHWAAHWDDLETAERLIRAGAHVNAVNHYGITPLSLACINGNAAMIEKLLKAGADPNATVREGETPLMTAARTGKVDAVKMLLTHNVDVNAKEAWNGQTALMWGIAEGHVPVARLLIEHGADIHARSSGGFTPLLFAARQGSLDVVRTLLAAGADVNETTPDGGTPLLVAILNGHEDLVDLLLEKGADPSVDGGSTKMTRPGTRVRPQKLAYRPLDNRTESRFKRQPGNLWGTPLHAAVHRANPERSDIYFTVQIDKVRVIKALLAHGANPNARIQTEEPRWPGARYHVDLIGATPFLLAAKAADLELMRLLLAHGADPVLGSKNHTTPLMAAAGLAYCCAQDRASESDVLEAVTLLVELGADVNAVNDWNETAMHGAAYRGANTVVQFLLKKGAKIDVKDNQGRTPLTIAEGIAYGGAFFAQPQTAALLRQLGAGQ
jgi:uncharacterized protein